MFVTRRDFMKLCGASAATLGLGAGEMDRLFASVTGPAAPSVIWLQGSGCTGCSVSFLNRIGPTAPQTVADILISKINLAYHPNVMGALGDLAVAAAEAAYDSGRFILVVEGGIPTAFNGAACWAWTYGGRDVTFQEAATSLADQAAHVLCVGTCACYGGMSAAPPNPTSVKGVRDLVARDVINVPGCPPHPDWIVWTLAQILLSSPIPLDRQGRPVMLFPAKIHDRCPRKGLEETSVWGQDLRCLKDLGCRGPDCYASCQAGLWNGNVNWCVDANVPCHNCTDPAFPFAPIFKNG